MAALTDDEVKACVAERDPSTKDYVFNHTMVRVKDPKKTLKFYSDVLGMRLLQRLDFPSMKFTLYFMGYEDVEDIPKTDEERLAWCFSRKAVMEFTHNWGSESDDSVQYHSGNAEPKGYGHIAIAVPDLQAACDRCEKLGVTFKKKPSDGKGNFTRRWRQKSGKMSGIAFILDPDGYWIELLVPKRVLESK